MGAILTKISDTEFTSSDTVIVNKTLNSQALSDEYSLLSNQILIVQNQANSQISKLKTRQNEISAIVEAAKAIGIDISIGQIGVAIGQK